MFNKGYEKVMMKIDLKKKGEWNPDYAFPM